MAERIPLEFLKLLIGYNHNNCVLWPFSEKENYGGVTICGVSRGAHRVMCELEHGHPPDEEAVAAHSCGRRRCVNPKHIRWATQKENSQDRLKHGTMIRGSQHKRARLQESQVLEIRTSSQSYRKLANMYGVSRATICAIKTRRNWGWLE